MSGYGDFCPISRGAEVFAQRWTPLIVRNLLAGCSTFSEVLAAAPGISRSLLTQRLRALEQNGILERRPGPGGKGAVYELTPAGEALAPVVEALGIWGEQWTALTSEHFDGLQVLSTVSRALRPEDMPDRKVSVHSDLDGPSAPRRLWLLMDRPHAELCTKPVGVQDDVVVATSTEWLTKWIARRITLGQAMHAHLIDVEGPRYLVRALARWDHLYPWPGLKQGADAKAFAT
jgi:DNA-binding HxlR family transcriptional regulator